ncbi:unnamed protein product [Brassica oleracea]
MVQIHGRSHHENSTVGFLRCGLCFGVHGEATDTETMERYRPHVLANPRRHKRRHRSSCPPREEIRSSEAPLISKNLLGFKLRRDNSLHLLRDSPRTLRRLQRRPKSRRLRIVLLLPVDRLSANRFRHRKHRRGHNGREQQQ